jgi:serine/threonine protein phosphatase PrpC
MSQPIFKQEHFIIGKCSVVGDARRKYEDRVRVGEVKTAGGLLLLVGAVADGVGSADNGALGAQLVIDTVFDSLSHSTNTEILSLMDQAIQQANQALYEKNHRDGKDGLTTLVLAVVYKDRLYIANVGDSRAYWVQPSGKMMQLTLDHTYGNLYGGSPDAREASRVVNILGRDPSVQVDFGLYLKGRDPNVAYRLGSQGMPLKPGDSILLCSDGLIKTDDAGKRYADDEEIVEALQTEFMPQRAAIKMVGIAEGRSPDDNVSAVTIQYLTNEIIEKVKAQSATAQRRALVLKAVGALAILALITAAAFLGYQWWTTQRTLEHVQKQPTATPDIRVVQITSTSEPTQTATLPIAPGQVRVEQINGGSEAYYWLDTDSTRIPVQYGLLIQPNMTVQTGAQTGLRFVVGEDAGYPSVVYLFPNSEMTLVYRGAIWMSLTRGAAYVQAGEQEAEIVLPGYGDVKAKVLNGRMILGLDGMDVQVLCFAGECRFSYNGGDAAFELQKGFQRVYHTGSSSADEKQEIAYLDAWKWSVACYRCLDGVVATPTAVPPTLTYTPDNRPDRPTVTSTPFPINTPEPPTNTPELPTNTLKPSTNTPKPPTNTPEPPTNTPKPPTNTPKPPTNTPTTPPPACEPVLAGDVDASTSQGEPVEITLNGAGTNISYTIVSDPLHGGLGKLKVNKVIYTPDADFTGDDTFTYRVTDQCGQTADATVTIHVGTAK